MNACSILFSMRLGACQSEVLIKANLLPTTDYVFEIIDKFNTHYKQVVISDSSGSITLDLTAFPPGLFTAYAGTFNMKVFDTSLALIQFNICDITYDGFALSFFNGEQTGYIIECQIVSTTVAINSIISNLINEAMPNASTEKHLILNNDATNTLGDGTAIFEQYTLQVEPHGITDWTVNVEVSLNGTSWQTAFSLNNTSPDYYAANPGGANIGAKYVKAALVTSNIDNTKYLKTTLAAR